MDSFRSWSCTTVTFGPTAECEWDRCCLCWPQLTLAKSEKYHLNSTFINTLRAAWWLIRGVPVTGKKLVKSTSVVKNEHRFLHNEICHWCEMAHWQVTGFNRSGNLPPVSKDLYGKVRVRDVVLMLMDRVSLCVCPCVLLLHVFVPRYMQISLHVSTGRCVYAHSRCVRNLVSASELEFPQVSQYHDKWALHHWDNHNSPQQYISITPHFFEAIYTISW